MQSVLRLAFLAAIMVANHASAQVAISVGLSPEEYVNDILLGEGIEASNVTFIGADIQIGHMTNGAGTIFPIEEGLVLSCDHAANSDQNFPDEVVPIGEGVSGDQDLLDIANSVPPLIGQTFVVGSVNDLAVLEFDFVATGDSISFNYSFGSDEYLTWINSQYNDIFAFLLSGPGLSGPYDSPAGFPDGAINIAEVPETDPPLPITISSVNPNSYDEYYIDNPSNTDIEINGFTVKLTASAQVICGETYHIKLAIADGTDTALESIVVLESGSFTSNNPAAISGEANMTDGVDLPTATILEGCVDGTFVFTINTDALDSDTLYYDVGGSATNGVDYEMIDDFIVIGPDFDGTFELEIDPIFDGQDEGDETIEITYVYTNGCGDTDTSSAVLYLIDLTPVEVSTEDIFICPGASESATADVSGGYAPYSYAWSNNTSGASTSFNYGEGNSYSVSVSDQCGQSSTANFVVEDGSLLTLTNPEEWYCLGIETVPLFSGGVAPVVLAYDDTGVYANADNSFGGIVEGTYTLSASDDCGQNLSVDVEWVACDTEVPNVFTPGNTDASNDFFVIDGLAGFPGSRLTVFNRWGNVVYEAEDYQNEWSGADMGGSDLSQGTYYWVFERSDGENFSGYVMILRD